MWLSCMMAEIAGTRQWGVGTPKEDPMKLCQEWADHKFAIENRKLRRRDQDTKGVDRRGGVVERRASLCPTDPLGVCGAELRRKTDLVHFELERIRVATNQENLEYSGISLNIQNSKLVMIKSL